MRLISLGAFLAVVGSNLSTLRPVFGIDSSFRVGLSIAAREPMSFTEDIVFPFGPLGFLGGPTLISRSQLALGVVYQLGMLTVLFATVIVLLRRQGIATRWAMVMLVPFAAAVSVTDNVVPELTAVTIVVVLVARWRDDVAGIPAATTSWVLVACSLVAGALMLVKVGPGFLACVVVVWFSIAEHPRARNVAIALAGIVVGFSTSWVAMGQPVRSVGAYFRWARELSGGYQDAQAYGPSTTATAAAGMLVIVLGVILAVAGHRWYRSDGAAALWPVAALFAAAWFTLKQGLVRWDEYHVIGAALMLALLLLLVRWEHRFRMLPVAVIVLASVLALAADPARLGSAWTDRADAALVLVSPARQAAMMSESRDGLRSSYHVPDTVIEALGAGTVHAEPWDVAALWGHELTWTPLPVFQTYSAYTVELDRINARRYASPDGPDAVLFSESTIDGRYGVWESPEVRLALTCNFTAVTTGDRWTAMQRTPNVCGRPREIGVVRTEVGASVSIPSPADPGSLVVARFELPRNPLGRLMRTVARPIRYARVAIDDTTYRLVIGTAENAHIVRSPGAVGGRELPHGEIDHRRLTFTDVGSGEVVVRFEEIPIDPDPVLPDRYVQPLRSDARERVDEALAQRPFSLRAGW